MARSAIPVAAIVLLIAGCASTPRTIIETEEVYIPVVTVPDAPEGLADPYDPPPLPLFISPTDERAAAALSDDGLTRLRLLLRELTARDEAWRAFYHEARD